MLDAYARDADHPAERVEIDAILSLPNVAVLQKCSDCLGKQNF